MWSFIGSLERMAVRLVRQDADCLSKDRDILSYKMRWVVNETSLRNTDLDGTKNYFLNKIPFVCYNIKGKIPQHVAFIMDGNRRFARQMQIEPSAGHLRGFANLIEVIFWCLQLGVREITTYTFGVDNFNRPVEMVDTLFTLAILVAEQLLHFRDLMIDGGICLRVVGDLRMLPEKLRTRLAELIWLTKDNDKIFVNLAMAYGTQHELTDAFTILMHGIYENRIQPDDITEFMLNDCLYTNLSPKPDMLIRTSGEVRFSDYLIWQLSGSLVSFPKVYWPNLSVWHLMHCMVQYQFSYKYLQQIQIRKPHQTYYTQLFLKYAKRCKMDDIKDMTGNTYL